MRWSTAIICAFIWRNCGRSWRTTRPARGICLPRLGWGIAWRWSNFCHEPHERKIKATKKQTIAVPKFPWAQAIIFDFLSCCAVYLFRGVRGKSLLVTQHLAHFRLSHGEVVLELWLVQHSRSNG